MEISRMTPDQARHAAQLEREHNSLQLVLKRWQLLDTPPTILRDLPPGVTDVPVPPAAWGAFRSACIAHVQACIAANRAAFGKL
jgi:hypothetical protein